MQMAEEKNAQSDKIKPEAKVKKNQKPIIVGEENTETKTSEGTYEEEKSTLSSKVDRFKAIILRNKLLAMIIAGLVAISFIGGVLYFIFKPTSKKEEVVEEIAAPIFFDLPEINTSIPKGKGKNGFLMVSFTLQLEQEEDREKIQKLQPNIMDAIQVYLSSLRLDTLSTDTTIGLISPIGLEKIRTNLILRINAVIAPAEIKTLLYKKFVAQ